MLSLLITLWTLSAEAQLLLIFVCELWLVIHISLMFLVMLQNETKQKTKMLIKILDCFFCTFDFTFIFNSTTKSNISIFQPCMKDFHPLTHYCKKLNSFFHFFYLVFTTISQVHWLSRSWNIQLLTPTFGIKERYNNKKLKLYLIFFA